MHRPLTNRCYKGGSQQLSTMSLQYMLYHYLPSLELRDPNRFHYDNVTVQRFMNTWFANAGAKELECPVQSPDLYPNDHLWHEMEYWLRPKPLHLTSVLDLTNTLVLNGQFPIATLQSLADCFPRRLDAVIAAKLGINLLWNVQHEQLNMKVQHEELNYSKTQKLFILHHLVVSEYRIRNTLHYISGLQLQCSWRILLWGLNIFTM